MYGVAGATREGASIVPTLKRVAVPEFKAREGVRIAANDAEAQAMSNQTEVSGHTKETVYLKVTNRIKMFSASFVKSILYKG